MCYAFLRYRRENPPEREVHAGRKIRNWNTQTEKQFWHNGLIFFSERLVWIFPPLYFLNEKASVFQLQNNKNDHILFHGPHTQHIYTINK